MDFACCVKLTRTRAQEGGKECNGYKWLAIAIRNGLQGKVRSALTSTPHSNHSQIVVYQKQQTAASSDRDRRKLSSEGQQRRSSQRRSNAGAAEEQQTTASSDRYRRKLSHSGRTTSVACSSHLF
eukprot:1151119-Pelagomonas_calceolata.AAC.3